VIAGVVSYILLCWRGGGGCIDPIDISPIQLNNSTQNDDEISTSPRGLAILYKTLLAENCQNLKMAAISRNM